MTKSEKSNRTKAGPGFKKHASVYVQEQSFLQVDRSHV